MVRFIAKFRQRFGNFIIASSLLLGGCYPCKLYAQESKALNVSLIPEIGFNMSYYHLTSNAYRKDFQITTGLGSYKNFYWGLALQLGLWNEWKATVTLGQAYIGGRKDYDFSRFSNLPEGVIFTGSKEARSFPSNLASLNFSKNIWRFRMGAIKGVRLSSELDILFGAGILWISKNNRVERHKSWLYRQRDYKNTWMVTNLASFTANPANNTVGTLNAGFSYHLYINNKERFIFCAQYSYGLHASYLMDYQSEYYYDNKIDNIHQSSIENFKAETGRHQYTLSIGYPIALYRNKAEKELLKEVSVSTH